MASPYGFQDFAAATPSTTDPRYADLLGDGLNPLPQAPERTPEELAAAATARAQFNETQRLASVPYGTPASQGGTAQGYRVTTAQETPGAVGASTANAGGSHVQAYAGDYTGPEGSWADAGPVRIDNYDANGKLVGAATQATLTRQPYATGAAGDTNVFTAPRMPLSTAIGGAEGVLPGQTLAPVTTGNIAGSPASNGQPPTTGSNPSAGGQYNTANPYNPQNTTAASGAQASAGAQNDQAYRDAQILAGMGQQQGAGGAAPRIDLANKDVQSFINEERARKGPSEGEALMAKATDRIMAQALGVASGARGTAGDKSAAMRQAISGNVALGAETSQNVAELRAKEAADQRNRLLTATQIGGNLAASGDQLGLGYTQTGANLYGQALQGSNTQAQLAAQQKLAADDQAWKEYMFGNLSASEKEAYRQAQLNKPSLGEQAVSTGLALLPAVGSLAKGFR